MNGSAERKAGAMGSDWPMYPLMPESGSGAQPMLPESMMGTSQVTAGRLSQPTTMTASLRAQKRAEAAQSAITELSVLTEQLLELPERLAQVNLVSLRARQLQEAMEAYADLARLAWDGMASGHLQATAATPLYRQRAVAVTRRVSRLQQEAATSRPIGPEALVMLAPAQRRARTGPLWKMRVRLYTDALLQWRAGLGVSTNTPPSVVALGVALEDLRAAVGLAGMGSGNLALMRFVSLLGLILGGVFATGYVSAAASALTLHLLPSATRMTVVALFLLLAWSYSLWISAVSNLSLGKLMGAARWRLHEAGNESALGILNGWRWFTAGLTLILGLGAIGGAGWLLRAEVQPDGALRTIRDLPMGLAVLTTAPVLPVVVALTGVLLLMPFIIALPSTVTYGIMLSRDLARDPNRVPMARRVLVRPALHIATLHLLFLLTGVLGLLLALHTTLTAFFISSAFSFSTLSLIVVGIIVAVYLFGIELPLRRGNARWKNARLGELATQKQEVANRLALLDPDPALAQDVPAVQYDVARLQFLKFQEDDIRRTKTGGARAGTQIVALLIVLATGLLAENVLSWGTRLLNGQ